MTREEAIKNIKEHCYFANLNPQAKEALDMAIEVLGQEPCEDCVSRQAAIEAVMDLCKYYTPTKSVNHPHKDFVIEILQDLPPVTPKQKTGHWVNGEYCSECGCDVPAYIIDWRWQKDMDAKYCPNCGIKMKGKSEE